MESENLKELEELNNQNQSNDNSNFKNKKFNINFNLSFKKIIIILVATILGVVIGFLIYKNNEKQKYESLPVKVDISMTSYYGTIDYILYEFDLDFDLVTMGANCFTGVQKNEFKTEKYGVLHTEFRYCKSNKTTILRIYNDETDQPLREPKYGEIPSFDAYGKKINNSTL